jgi:hypothetical protein
MWNIPCGPRFKLYPFEISENFFKQKDDHIGSPTICELNTQEYIKNFSNKHLK